MKDRFTIGLVVLFGFAIVILTMLCVSQHSQITTLEQNQIELDSLRQEVFNLGVENGRYEITLDHLYETNPRAAQEFEEYMFHETE